ncbi:hypothetical protein ACWGUP_21645 [Streptomyces diastaticus]
MVLTPVRAALLTLGAALFLVAGCQSPGHRAATPAPPDPRPLDGVLTYAAADEAALWQAEESAVRACMRARGHAYRVGEEAADRRAAGDSPFALLRPDEARNDGYGLTSAHLAGRPPDPNAEHLATLTAKERRHWRDALLGEEENHRTVELPGGLVMSHDPGSCVSRAQTEVYGERWPELYYTVQELSNAVIGATQESAAFRRAQREWAGCMEERGHRYRALDDPRQEIRALLEDEGETGDEESLRTVGLRELELAGADVDCQVESGLHQVVEAAAKEAGRPLVEESRAELKRYERARKAALSALDR